MSSVIISIMIIDPALITLSPDGITLPAGFPQYKMLCSARGIPVPTITWLKDGVPLMDNSSDDDVRHIFIDPGQPFVFPSLLAPEFGFIQSTIVLAELVLRFVNHNLGKIQLCIVLKWPFWAMPL